MDPVVRTCVGNLGMVLTFGGRHADAIPTLRQSISLIPGNALLHGCLGSSLYAVGERIEARENFQRAIELDPTILTKCHEIRVQLLRQQRGDEFRSLWRRALAADPPKPDAWDGYAELSLFLGLEDEYRWACREILKRFGGATDPRVAERVGRACRC